MLRPPLRGPPATQPAARTRRAPPQCPTNPGAPTPPCGVARPTRPTPHPRHSVPPNPRRPRHSQAHGCGGQARELPPYLAWVTEPGWHAHADCPPEWRRSASRRGEQDYLFTPDMGDLRWVVAGSCFGLCLLVCVCTCVRAQSMRAHDTHTHMRVYVRTYNTHKQTNKHTHTHTPAFALTGAGALHDSHRHTRTRTRARAPAETAALPHRARRPGAARGEAAWALFWARWEQGEPVIVRKCNVSWARERYRAKCCGILGPRPQPRLHGGSRGPSAPRRPRGGTTGPRAPRRRGCRVSQLPRRCGARCLIALPHGRCAPPSERVSPKQ